MMLMHGRSIRFLVVNEASEAVVNIWATGRPKMANPGTLNRSKDS